AAARAVSSGSRGGAPGRPVAARLPEDAERAAEGRAQPGPPDLTRGSSVGSTLGERPPDVPPGGAMTDTAERTASTDVVDEVRAWLEENWDPDLTVGEWWERLGLAGWAAPGLP